MGCQDKRVQVRLHFKGEIRDLREFFLKKYDEMTKRLEKRAYKGKKKRERLKNRTLCSF